MLLLWYRLRKKRLEKKKRRKYWVRPIFLRRKVHGQFHQMLTELREGDREYYFRYMRMSPERFDHLLSLVEDKISKQDTRLFAFCAQHSTVSFHLFRKQ